MTLRDMVTIGQVEAMEHKEGVEIALDALSDGDLFARQVQTVEPSPYSGHYDAAQEYHEKRHKHLLDRYEDWAGCPLCQYD